MHINISISNEILETEYQISSDQISQLVNVLQGSYILTTYHETYSISMLIVNRNPINPARPFITNQILVLLDKP